MTGLAIFNNRLAAGYDPGTGSGDSVRLFDATTGTQIWRIGDATAGNDSSRRGMGGVAFDPGFNGANATLPNVAYLSPGSGRRHRLNQVTGMYVNGQNVGAIINFPTVSTTRQRVIFTPASRIE